MPLDLLKALPETTTGGIIAIVIVCLVLWYLNKRDKTLSERDAIFAKIILDFSVAMRAVAGNMKEHTELYHQTMTTVAISTEVLRNLTTDVQEIKEALSPLKFRRGKS